MKESLSAGSRTGGGHCGILVLGASVVEFEKKMIDSMQEDPGEIDEEMAKIIEKKPKRKIYSKGFVWNW